MRDTFKLAYETAQFAVNSVIRNAEDAMERLQVVNFVAHLIEDAALNFNRRRGTMNLMLNFKESIKSTRQPWPHSSRRMKISPGE